MPSETVGPGLLRRAPLAAAAVLLAAAAPRVWAAWADQGIFWPDEIYQSLEQAHRAAFGYGMVPWEFRTGARSWLLPGAIGAGWRAMALLGLDSAPALVRAAKLSMAALSVAGVGAGMWLAAQLSGRRGALVAGALAAAFPASLVFGARAMSESASGPLLVAAAALLVGPSTHRRAAAAGALAAAAATVRYQSGLLLLGVLAHLLWERRWRSAAAFTAAALAAALLLAGALDWATWGAPFHSLRAYVEFNLLTGQASRFGTAPAGYYARTLWTSTGPALVAVLLGLALAARRAPALVAAVAAFVLAHTAIPHKELRFLMPVIPLALALAGAGLADLFGRLPAPNLSTAALAAVLAAAMATQARALTFGQMGQWLGEGRAGWSVWHRCEDVNLLSWQASSRPDLCGLSIVGSMWNGGYTYLHRDVPLLWGAGPQDLLQANYLLLPTVARPPPGYERLASEGDFGLYRRDGPCAPPGPGYSRNMPGP